MSDCIKLSEVVYDNNDNVRDKFDKIYMENYLNPTSKIGYCSNAGKFTKLEKKDKITENIPSIISGIVLEPIANIDQTTIIDLNDLNNGSQAYNLLFQDVTVDEKAVIIENLKKINNINSRKISKEIKILLISKINFTSTQQEPFKRFILNYCNLKNGKYSRSWIWRYKNAK